MHDNLNLKIKLQQLVLFFESFWFAVQKPLVIIGLVIIGVASGGLMLLPSSVAMASLGALTLVFLYTLKDLFKLRLPQRLAAMRRMEQASLLTHRHISSFDDTLVGEAKKPDTDALWEEHQRRKLAALAAVKNDPPKSNWRKFDPAACRVPVALGAVTALLLGPGDFLANVQNGMALSPARTIQPLTVDAWLKPPAYTGKAPLLLTSAAMTDKLAAGGDIVVPENAVLNLRVQGAAHPRLAFYSLGVAPETELKLTLAKTATTESGFTADVKLDRPLLVKVLDGTTELASWPITLIPDEPPKIKIAGEPGAEKAGGLSIGWETSDDYGIKAMTAEISLADQQENGMGFESNGVFLYDPPVFKISNFKANAKTDAGITKQDLAAHPWAGLYVEVVLTATDAAGHATRTPPVRFKMPERSFFKFLSKALVEQRKKLILTPDESPNVATMLDTILAYPYSIREQSKLILRLSSIKARLSDAGDADAVAKAVTDLWPLSVAIEDGELADARAELKSLKQQLEQALRDGAAPEKIAELMDKMRKAMDKLLSQMQKEAEKRQAEGGKPQQGRDVTKQDLQKMLDDIEKLSKSGAKDAAEQMLSELDKLLQNLQPGGTDQSQNGDPGLQQKMDELSDLMKRQQQLMDETQKLDPGGGDKQGPGLSDRQGKLSERLDRLGRDLGGDPKDTFGDASKKMKDAQGSLNDGSKDDALRQQGEAMNGMQDGAKKIGKKLAQQGQGKTGEDGKDGQAGGNDDDPLGRPRATHSPQTGPNKNTVPSEMAMRRAREILEQLRNRSNDQNLSDTERNYIERLLKGLY